MIGISGGIIITLGIVIWFIAALRSGMDENITENKLKTDEIYSRVRIREMLADGAVVKEVWGFCGNPIKKPA